MATGTVKWFDSKKGFGFITGEDGGKDIFVHFSSIKTEGSNDYKTLEDGARVEFDIVESEKKKGPEAKNVVVIGDGDERPAKRQKTDHND